jgi:tetratricopeptide (TPR) repeat protein
VQGQEVGVRRVLLVHGLGGTGKTQLVRQYIEDHKDEYNPVLWIDAMDAESVRASFERCAGELGLSVDLRGTQSSKLVDFPAIQAVLRWFRNRKWTDERWLMVIDNADNHEMGIRSIIPEGNQGSIIITSQDSKLLNRMKNYREVEVGIMDSLEAKTLLLGHLKLEVSIAPDDVLVDCGKIAEKLGYLPLAVDLAGAYIGNDVDPMRALRQYLADYEQQQDFLLRSNSFCDSSASDKTVWTVWSTTLRRVEQRHADLRPGLLLAFLARFRSDVVHDELLRLASLSLSTVAEGLYSETTEVPEWLANILKFDGKDWVDFYYRQGCDVLVRYNLLQRTTGTWQGVRMHSLVEWRAKKYEEEQSWEQWHFMTVLAGCIQLSRFEARPAFRRELITNVPALDAKYLDRVGVEDDRKAFVWNTIGLVYFYAGHWEVAEEMFTKVIEISSRVLGSEHPGTLAIIDNLASTIRKQDRWEEAENLFIQLIEIRKRVLGEGHPDTLATIANLASTYSSQGQWKDAEELEVQVMEINLKVLGEEHPDTLTIMGNLATTYRDQGKWKEAEELFVQAMETSLRVLGEEHPNTLFVTANLALAYRNRGRWKEAEELFVRVREIKLRMFGEEHLDTVSTSASLALTYGNQGRWKEAEELEVQIMRIRKRVQGEEHPDTLASVASLALTLWKQGRRREAEELYRQVTNIRKRVLRAGHLDTSASIAKLV